VGRSILDRLNQGAVVVNYDRGEVIDAASLRTALESGKVGYVCVDADIFLDANVKPTGPLAPYLELAKRFPRAFELLPHAAGDTEHTSRVEGAKQALDQIIRAIRYKEVVNLKGELPKGYVDVGSHTVSGVGKVGAGRLRSVASDKHQVDRLRILSEGLAVFWGALASTDNPERRAQLIEHYGARLILESNRYATVIEELGLRGPYAAV
jgi:hypothetical protein